MDITEFGSEAYWEYGMLFSCIYFEEHWEVWILHCNPAITPTFHKT